MKILHIAEFGKRANGIGTVVERLQKEQLLMGHDVRIVTISENIAFKHLELNTISSQSCLDDFLKKWRPDAVLFHSMWAMPYIGFYKVLLRHGISYAIMMHGADSKENRKSSPLKKWLANKLWFDEFMKKASAIVYLSKSEESNCLSSKNNCNNVIIPNGCDRGCFDPSNTLLHNPLNIVYLGRMAKYHKGVDVLLDALEILDKRNYTEMYVSFYANENDIDLLYLKDRLKGLERIATYKGGVYGNDKNKVLKEADAFILTSRFEGMPMGVLEAISYGVPCLLTPGTNMADDICSAGAGWKTELDANAIADTITSAVHDLKKNYHTLHCAAYDFSKSFDWKIIASKHVELMQEISKRKS